MMRSIAKPAALAVLVASSVAAESPDFAPLCGTTLRVGVRTDAPPFAFATTDGMRTPNCTSAGSALPGFGGFTASLCRGFLDAAQASCGASDPITVETVPVPIADRDKLLSAADGGLDLLCGATTATVTRRVLLPTSPYTFLTGSAIVTNQDFAAREDGASCRVGVVGGTTSASDAGFSAREIRLPGWSQFAAANGCEDGDLDPRRRHDYPDTRTALEDLSKRSARKADLLIDDLHVLQWYLDNFAAVTDTETAARRARLELRRDILSIEPYAVMGSAASGARVGAQQDEMSDGLAARPAPGVAVAAFARYMTDLQADKVAIDGAGYGDLLRRCFGRRIDRNMWFLIDLQANVRKGDFAADPVQPDTGQ